MTTARRRAATVAAVAVLPVAVWQAASLAASGAQGGGTPTGKALTTSVLSTTEVAPGHAGSVTVKVTNPNKQAVILTSLSGAVTGVASGSRAGLPPCDKSWIVLGSFQGSRSVAGNGWTTVTVPVTFSNLGTTNQDNCKGVGYTFSFTVTGRQA